MDKKEEEGGKRQNKENILEVGRRPPSQKCPPLKTAYIIENSKM